MIFVYLLFLIIFHLFLFSSLLYSLNIYFPSELNLLKFIIISIIVALIPVITIKQLKDRILEKNNVKYLLILILILFSIRFLFYNFLNGVLDYIFSGLILCILLVLYFIKINKNENKLNFLIITIILFLFLFVYFILPFIFIDYGSIIMNHFLKGESFGF